MKPLYCKYVHFLAEKHECPVRKLKSVFLNHSSFLHFRNYEYKTVSLSLLFLVQNLEPKLKLSLCGILIYSRTVIAWAKHDLGFTILFIYISHLCDSQFS